MAALWGDKKTLPQEVKQQSPITEVHPGISDFAQVKKVTDFLAAMEFSAEDRHAILMKALDTGVIEIPISKLVLPNFARTVTAETVSNEVKRELGSALGRIQSELMEGRYF